MAKLSDSWSNPGSDTKGEGKTSTKVMKNGGSDSEGKLYTGTGDAVYASRTGDKVASRIPENKSLIKRYEFKKNWGK